MAAAGTYGEPGKNPFSVKGIGGVLSPVVNAGNGVIQIYRQDSALNVLTGKPQYTSLGTYNPSTGKFTADPNANLSDAEIKSLSNAESINNIKNAAKSATVKGAIDAGATDADAKAQADKLITPNSGKTGTGDGQGGNNEGQDASEDLKKDLNDLREGTRYKKNPEKNSFPSNLVYPANLQIEHQDVIQFNMLSYEKRSFNEGSTGAGNFGERSNYTERTIGRVTLPIPGGISDTNSVNWNGDTLESAAKAFADVASSFITGGGSEAAKTIERKVEQVPPKEVQSALTAGFIGQAISKSNILSRSEGAIANPNMELLFSGVTLRPFSFTFKLSARGVDDREQIRKIIRFFKQGMAAQRTASQLFLKAPNTFKIRYLHKTEEGQKDHPYINYIKECALLSFTVNYTPEGNYMTFADGLMTSYEISMQFQELEPIFNDDYYGIDKNKDTHIGY